MNHLRINASLLCVLWGGLAVAVALGAFVLPKEFFCFRAWECVFRDHKETPFDPLYHWDGASSGDIGHQLGIPKYMETRSEVFSTDEYGFRNPLGTLDKHCCDIVLFANSFGGAPGINDGEYLPDLIRNNTQHSVYNYSGTDLFRFLTDTRFEKHHPKLAIFFYVERNLRSPIFKIPGSLQPYSPKKWDSRNEYEHSGNYTNPFRADTVMERLNDSKFLRKYFEGVYKGSLYSLGLYSIPKNLKVFPYHGRRLVFMAANVDSAMNPQKYLGYIDGAVAGMKRYHDEFQKWGTKLLILVPPNKATLYANSFISGNSKSAFGVLEHAHNEFDKAGLDNIRIYEGLRKAREQHPDEMLYFVDDTHLNAQGHRVIFETIRGEIEALVAGS